MLWAPWKLPTLALRPWRLVRELDPFSDHECRVYCHSVQSTRVTGLALAGPLALATLVALVALYIQLIEPLIPRGSRLGDTDLPEGRAVALALAAVPLTIVVWVAFLPYCLLLRRAIQKKIALARCPGCRYPLLGLPISAGRVLCPECGLGFALDAHGLRPEDLASGVLTRAPVDTPVPDPLARETAWFLAALAIAAAIFIATGSEHAFLQGLGLAILLRCAALVPAIARVPFRARS